MFQGTPPKELQSTDKLAKQLKFDDEEQPDQLAKLELLKELSELEDLLAKRFEAMKISETNGSPGHAGTNGLPHEGSKDSRVVWERPVPQAPALSHGLSMESNIAHMSHTCIHTCMHACMHARILCPRSMHLHSRMHPPSCMTVTSTNQDLDNVETMVEIVEENPPVPEESEDVKTEQVQKEEVKNAVP